MVPVVEPIAPPLIEPVPMEPEPMEPEPIEPEPIEPCDPIEPELMEPVEPEPMEPAAPPVVWAKAGAQIKETAAAAASRKGVFT